MTFGQMSDGQALAHCQSIYAERGFLVMAFRLPKNAGEQIVPNDDCLRESARWRVVGPSTVDEFLHQTEPAGTLLDLNLSPYLYRVEAMD